MLKRVQHDGAFDAASAIPTASPSRRPGRQHVALAFGPWLVRLADVGPVAAGFWRLALALPFLFVIAAMTGQPVHWPGRKLALLVACRRLLLRADLAAWHAGIHMTKLGNATLFGNIVELRFAARACGWPGAGHPRCRRAALGLAAVGAALLMGSSFELSPRNFARRPAALSPACFTPAI